MEETAAAVVCRCSLSLNIVRLYSLCVCFALYFAPSCALILHTHDKKSFVCYLSFVYYITITKGKIFIASAGSVFSHLLCGSFFFVRRQLFSKIRCFICLRWAMFVGSSSIFIEFSMFTLLFQMFPDMYMMFARWSVQCRCRRRLLPVPYTQRALYTSKWIFVHILNSLIR